MTRSSFGKMPEILRLTSCQASNTYPIMQFLPNYLGRHLDREIHYENSAPWQTLFHRLYAGEIHLGWLCSKQYALQLDTSPRQLIGIVVPVAEGALYEGNPIYYSYLVVHRDHKARSLKELENGRVAYNEPGSQSGYFSLLSALKDIGAKGNFFSEWVESGAHKNSIQLLQNKRVDIAAIDSTLWDYEVGLDRDRFSQLKIIDTLGPYPAPPLVAHPSVSEELIKQLRRLLTRMHLDPAGREVLKAAQISRFAPISDAYYQQLLY